MVGRLESYNRCAVDNRLAGHCGEQRPANLTTCLSVEGETYTKEFIVGPFVTTGGNDWTAINYVATLGALEDGMEPADLAIRDYSFTNVRDSPWGAQLGFPPLHNHHTTMHGADGDCEAPPQDAFRPSGSSSRPTPSAVERSTAMRASTTTSGPAVTIILCGATRR